MAYFCNGKKGICLSDGEECSPDCAFFNGEGGYDTEIGRELTPDIVYIFDTLGSRVESMVLPQEFKDLLEDLKKEFNYEV